MNTISVLLTGPNEDQLRQLQAKLNEIPQWISSTATSADLALEMLHQQHFDVVIITDGVTKEEVKKLCKIVDYLYQDVAIATGISTNNENIISEVETVLKNRKLLNKPSFTFTDDPLKNAAIRISYQ